MLLALDGAGGITRMILLLIALMRRSLDRTLLFPIALLLTLTMAVSGSNDRNENVPVKKGAQVIHLVKHDTSPALRDIPPGQFKAGVKRVHPIRPLPQRGFDPNKPVTGELDANVQMTFGTMAMPTPATNFAGISDGVAGFNVASAPPDTVGDVGPSHYVQMVNTAMAIYNKSGSLLWGPNNINTIWSGFGGGCQTNNDGDPTVTYDQINNRWVIAQFSVSTTPYLECVAVSQTGDPTGAYHRFAYGFGNVMNDYPKVGMWRGDYYITYNMFTNGQSWAGGKVCAHDGAKMRAGQANTMQCFDEADGGLLPADMDGSAQPPSGAPEYVISFGTNTLNIWQLNINWTTPASSTFTGPTVRSVNSFTQSSTVPQPGTTVRLDALSDRLMNRLAYRNRSGVESFVLTHSVASGSVAGLSWYELRSSNTATSVPTVFQQGTYAPDTNHRWMGSVAMDQSGNIAAGYSVSSSSINPSIRYSGRLATDPAGQFSQGEATLFAGGGSQTGGLTRWGDYSSLNVDPSDDCTFWFTTEYLAASGSFNWSTRIGSFKFASCGGVADTTPPTTSLTAPANGATVSGTITVSANASDNVGVTNVEFYRGTTLIGSDSTSPYSISWDTTSVTNGSYSLTSRAYDAAGNNASSTAVSVTVSNVAGPPALTATFDATRQAPTCGSGGRSCDTSTSLINGRANITGGAEPNQPNTINDSCADGTSGTYHSDESVDRLIVATNDGSALAGGKTVTVSATVWCYTSSPSSDSLDLYYTSNAASPTWTLIGTQTCTAGGAQTLTRTYVLPSTGTQHAVRANYRYQGTASSCSTGSYDDHDDLVFGVTQSADTTPPSTSLTAPANGATVSGTITVSANASDNVGVTNVEFYRGTTLIGSDTSSPYSVSWNTTGVANGGYSLTSKAYDAAGNNATSAAVNVTVNNVSIPDLTATYNSTYKAPACGSGGKSCDTGVSLINGRGTMTNGNETNRPNTINNSCVDGNSGTYHVDESIDRMRIATNDGSALASGKAVTVTVTVWCYGTTDSLDLYRTATIPGTGSPTWTLIGTQSCTAGGVARSFTATYTLPIGTTQAIRGNYRYGGTAGTCSTGGYNDRDDLVFGVQ